MALEVLSTPGHLISLAARAFARLSEARLKPLGFGVGHLPVLVALQNGQAGTQRDLALFARIEQPSMAQMLARMERDGIVRRQVYAVVPPKVEYSTTAYGECLKPILAAMAEWGEGHRSKKGS